MKINSTQQEILLVPGTSFLTQELWAPRDGVNSNHLTEKEKLKIACRNGLLHGMLPEIFEQHSVNKKLCLWVFTEGSLFIELKSDEVYSEVDMQFSIDPNSFLPMQTFS